ncbi:hypothetical protein PMIN01_11801 [Paraphaeosphaeria minitans]|uniref:Uncharacterized protein n=1 Tax=Paraphaeosphaeria minitans TaxID=565426 RepID=A0A9P6G7E4_9PLEO|nr:hypothetical protein PMIN01_11801 [Paraphaeosphaeria minitans]
MDAIVNKIRKDLIKHIISYQGENVTQRLMSELNYAIFLTIPEKIRIEDMKQSTEFREEMMGVFEEKDPTKPGTPYLGQLKEQDSCYAARNCKFDFGQTLYQCTSCKKNFVCEEHKTSTCMLCLAGIATKETKEVTGSDKDREDSKSIVKYDAHSEDQDAESGEEDAESGDEDAESGDEDAESGDEDANATSKDKGEDESEGKNVDSRDIGTRERSAAITKDIDEKEDPLSKEKGQERAAKFQVEDIQNLSMDDFHFKGGNFITELQVCQVQTRSGELIWVVLQDYVKLKEDYVKREADSDGNESDRSRSGFGWKNRKNADIGM